MGFYIQVISIVINITKMTPLWPANSIAKRYPVKNSQLKIIAQLVEPIYYNKIYEKLLKIEACTSAYIILPSSLLR